VSLAENDRLAQIERALRQSLRDLQHRDGELRESQHRLQTISDALPILVSYIDEERRYRFANAAYERWFGRPRTEFIGRPMRDLLGEEVYEQLRPHLDLALAGRTANYQMHAAYRHGGQRFIEATYIPDFDEEQKVRGVVALVTDITHRKHLEDARGEMTRQTARLMKVTAAIAEAVTPDQVVHAIVDEVAATIDATSAGLWLMGDDTRTVSLVRAFGPSEETRPELAAAAIDGAFRFPALDAIRGREPIWITSPEELSARYPEFAANGVPEHTRSVACLPLALDGRTLGALGLTFDDTSGFDEDDRTFLLLVARSSGQALERVRLLDAERRSRARAEASAFRWSALSRASHAFSEAGTNLSTQLGAVAEQVTLECADACAVMLIAEGGEALELAAAHCRQGELTDGLRALFEGTRRQVGDGLEGQVASTGNSVVLPVFDATTGTAGTMAIVPLRARGRIIGTLSAYRQQGSVAPTDEDVEFLEELAGRAAMAIERSRLYEDNQKGRVRAELLYRLARVVIGAENPEQLFDAALSAIERGLDTSRSSVLIFDGEGIMRFRAWRGLSARYRRAVEGHSPWSCETRDPSPILVGDVEADDALAEYRAILRDEGIRALAFIPLVADGVLLGKFMVYYGRTREFGQHELEMAKAIANHVAAGISRFSAVSELRDTVRFNEMFTGILGHDLRNPLTAIMAAAQMAMKQGGSERLFKPLSRILSSSERMGRMIGQLLDLTRVRVGQGIPLEPRRFDLVPVVRQVMEELDDANPDWTLRLDRSGDTEGTWDADRLSQVFSNLIANAVQHGIPEHGVRVRIDGTDAWIVAVEIRNMGAIPPEVAGNLFEPMARAGRGRDKSRGLGLGLYITHEILRAHGARIEVESSEESGTLFKVVLPRAAPRTRPPQLGSGG
jgi:PAS domain S-box-containing protein